MPSSGERGPIKAHSTEYALMEFNWINSDLMEFIMSETFATTTKWTTGEYFAHCAPRLSAYHINCFFNWLKEREEFAKVRRESNLGSTKSIFHRNIFFEDGSAVKLEVNREDPSRVFDITGFEFGEEIDLPDGLRVGRIFSQFYGELN